MKTKKDIKDVILIGGGIMSATLGTIMKKLIPNAKITIYEKLNNVAEESTNCENNAGTGHSGFCELNYTPQQEDGTVNIKKALNIASSFEISRQFWAYLKSNNIITESFIKTVPHMNFLCGKNNVSFLKKRYETMIEFSLFEDMMYSEDFETIESWIPMMMKHKSRDKKIAVTKMIAGTDVDFETITKGLITHLKNSDNVEVLTNHKVEDLNQSDDGIWNVKIKDNNGEIIEEQTKFVFIGAGGASLQLLQKSEIKEGKGYGGFPVSGKFMRCNVPEITKQHMVKVYGKADNGTPPMSMPHLDIRKIMGKDSLLFGPYAGMSLKFLKTGSNKDLLGSVKLNNIWSMLSVAKHEFGLIKYLIRQTIQSKNERLKTLKKYFPDAKMENWELYTAGQRVQIMKDGGLNIGTEIINNKDGSLVALLGASPGASVSVSIMLDVLNSCFLEQMNSDEWKNKIKEMIPSYGKSLIEDKQLCRDIRKYTAKILRLEK